MVVEGDRARWQEGSGLGLVLLSWTSPHAAAPC